MFTMRRTLPGSVFEKVTFGFWVYHGNDQKQNDVLTLSLFFLLLIYLQHCLLT